MPCYQSNRLEQFNFFGFITSKRFSTLECSIIDVVILVVQSLAPNSLKHIFAIEFAVNRKYPLRSSVSTKSSQKRERNLVSDWTVHIIYR